MIRNKGIMLFLIVPIGIIVPFVPALTLIEMFVLLIPFAIIFIVTLIYLLLSLFVKNIDSRRAVLFFSVIPTFIISQLASVFVFNQIQRLRSNIIISEIESIKKETGVFPEKYNSITGIKYVKMKDDEKYVIKYSSGFMITEKYNSEDMNWRSYGWND